MRSLADIVHVFLRSTLLTAIISVSLGGCQAPKRIAIIGEGVIGLSTALAIKELEPDVELHIFHHMPFEKILSSHIAGLFRINDRKYKQYGKETFDRLAKLWRTYGGVSGVQLVSGHILSDDPDKLQKQKENYGDIVYNFRFLDDWEIKSQFVIADNDNSSAIHYTAFTSEGAKYCPWMRNVLLSIGVEFHERTIGTLDELADEGFSVVVNCAGIKGGELAGDDTTVYPIRGILLKVDAPWQKHFLYRDFSTFTIPVIDGVVIGTVKKEHAIGGSLTEEDLAGIWRRYTALQPAMQNVTILSHFVGERPGRAAIRVEAQRRITRRGTRYLAVHNYGHGGNGFTLAWGSGMHAASLAFGKDVSRYATAAAAIKPEPSPNASMFAGRSEPQQFNRH